jgi:branched-chain amino acid transport system permease protein
MLISPYWEQIIVFMGINSILALGFYVTFSTGQMSMCHGGLMGIGAYVSGLLSLHTSLPFYSVLVIASLCSGIAGVLIAYPTLKLRHFYLAIATLGFGQIFVVIATATPALGGALGITNIPYKANIVNVYVTLGILCFVFTCLYKSRFWIACNAIKDDELTAESSGINTSLYKAISFGLGGFIAGIGGVFEVHYISSTLPHGYDIWKSVEIFLFTLIGGTEIFVGAIFGAFLLTLLPEVLRFVSQERMLIYGVMLILIMIFRPQGLLDRGLVEKFVPYFLKKNSVLDKVALTDAVKVELGAVSEEGKSNG